MFAIAKSPEIVEDTDECLLPFLSALEDASSQRCLEQLLTQTAKPIVEQIVQRILPRPNTASAFGVFRLDVEDATSEILLKLLQRLQACKADPVGQPISNFRGLVAKTAYRKLTDRLREHDRQRANREKRLRRLFVANRHLAIWKNREGVLICGYQSWRDVDAAAGKHVTQDDLLVLVDEYRRDSDRENTAEIVLLILDHVWSPIGFPDLVNALAPMKASEPKDIPLALAEARFPERFMTLDEPAALLEAKLLLTRLFDEIQHLGSIQRRALLLNMVDSYGYSIEWILFTQIATEQQLATVLEVPVSELKALLDRVPMTDREIAEWLGIAESKLGNIRKAVRDRLKRCRLAFIESRTGTR